MRWQKREWNTRRVLSDSEVKYSGHIQPFVQFQHPVPHVRTRGLVSTSGDLRTCAGSRGGGAWSLQILARQLLPPRGQKARVISLTGTCVWAVLSRRGRASVTTQGAPAEAWDKSTNLLGQLTCTRSQGPGQQIHEEGHLGRCEGHEEFPGLCVCKTWILEIPLPLNCHL